MNHSDVDIAEAGKEIIVGQGVKLGRTEASGKVMAQSGDRTPCYADKEAQLRLRNKGGTYV